MSVDARGNQSAWACTLILLVSLRLACSPFGLSTVLPYIYTHLISFSCVIYLVGIAFLKGCTSPRSLTHLWTGPTARFHALAAVTVLGLVSLVHCLQILWGVTAESFAVCHFLNYTCTSSLEAVSTSRAPTASDVRG